VIAYLPLFFLAILLDLFHRLVDIFLVRLPDCDSPLFLQSAIMAWVGFFGSGVFDELRRFFCAFSCVNALVDQDAGSRALRSVIVDSHRRPVDCRFGRSTMLGRLQIASAEISRQTTTATAALIRLVRLDSNKKGDWRLRTIRINIK
jgi:hypothetical protein